MKSNLNLKTIFLLGLIANSLLAAPLTRNFSISNLNEKNQKINGIEFPRLKEIKYRGVDPIQMDRNKAIRAMLGDETANIESVLFSAVKLALMGRDIPFISLVSTIFSDRDLHSHINRSVSKNHNKYFSEVEAQEKALVIIEKSIRKHLWKRGFLNLYVDYRSNSLELWAKEVIFSTVYLEVANIYSKDIVVIDDRKQSEMLDLNYWNLINNGNWVYTVHPWVDKGEFITPIYLSYDKVVGFKQYDNKWLSHQIYQDLQNNLKFAYFKDQDKKEILIFDGVDKSSRQQAIINENDTFYYAKSNFNEYADVPNQLTNLRTKANLIGIIKLCPKTTNCTLSTSAFSKYPKSSKTFPTSVINSITSIDINNYSPKLFYYNATLDKDSKITDPYHYDNKLSPQVYNKRLAKKSKSYKAIESDVNPKQSRNKLVYELDNVKIDKDKALYLLVPRSYRNKAVKEIKIWHKQDLKYETGGITDGDDWDKTPAYSSVQFHSADPNVLDKWRYSAYSTRNPKGSIFAKLSTSKRGKSSEIDYWLEHRGSENERKSNDILNFDSIRIVNVGEDPILVNKLEVRL